jgi:dTMP kinase
MTIGQFITMEGGEGTGKSTQIRLLVDRLKSAGIHALATREPGGSPGAERIRSLLLAAGQARFDALTETMLFFAARNDHLESVIRPALRQGHWVISDRFSDSTRVYQGEMGHIEMAVIDQLDHLVVRDTQPALTLILDLPADVGLARAQARRGAQEADGFEAESLAFHRALRERYLDLAHSFPERCMVIDAAGDITEVAERLWDGVSSRFGLMDKALSRG